jgi:hypothetical protein
VREEADEMDLPEDADPHMHMKLGFLLELFRKRRPCREMFNEVNLFKDH